jgi:tetratricopeptide (TPR) repeat protein
MERGSDAMSRGDFKQAVVFFRAAKELKPDATGPLLALGLALRANGDCQEAIAHLEEYYKRKPEGDPKGKSAIEFCKKEIERQRAAAEAAKAPLAAQQVTQPPVVEEPPKPIYKRWYLWTPIAVGVVGAVVLGVLLGLPGAKAPASSVGLGPAQTANLR